MSSLRVCSIALVATLGMVATAACVEPESDLDLGEEAQSVSSPEGQGSDIQGSDIQGSDIQGSDIQGSDIQGSDIQGGTYGGAAVADASINGTSLSVYRLLRGFPVKLEERRPDRVCLWNTTKTISYGCTSVALTGPSAAASPLAGAAFNARLKLENGLTFDVQLRIGQGTSTIGAVLPDTTKAMYPLDGHASAAACVPVACDNPKGCRPNCDLWTYDVDVLYQGAFLSKLCPAGARAIAIPGTYATNGSFAPSSTTFTFACTTGTAAKCTRWGYRPFGSTKKSDGTVVTNLVDYHQSCVRAAMADYCGTGNTFTKNGTLVDVFDYRYFTEAGLIPSTYSIYGGSAFAKESTFDTLGAISFDQHRYEEAIAQFGTVNDYCPGRFDFHPSDDVGGVYDRKATVPWSGPKVSIDTSTSCAHSERVPGKWLSKRCSVCASRIGNTIPHCTDPLSPLGWDQECINQIPSLCTQLGSPPIAAHSECVSGAKLNRLSSGCTLRVCSYKPTSGPDYSYCCNNTWDSACTTVANNLCEPFKKNGTTYSFCGYAATPPNPL